VQSRNRLLALICAVGISGCGLQLAASTPIPTPTHTPRPTATPTPTPSPTPIPVAHLDVGGVGHGIGPVLDDALDRISSFVRSLA